MAMDALTGNMATENVLSFLDEAEIEYRVDRNALTESIQLVGETFLQE
jgi:hypothetical protein